jgi:hypothetical protein
MSANSQVQAGEEEDIPYFAKKELTRRTLRPAVEEVFVYSGSTDWQAAIDSTWGSSPLTPAQRLQILNTFWDTIDEKFACFQNLEVDWAALKALYEDEVQQDISRGRFAAIMNHLALALRESHTYVDDVVVNRQTAPEPGVPLLFVGGWGDNGHFGAGPSVPT